MGSVLSGLGKIEDDDDDDPAGEDDFYRKYRWGQLRVAPSRMPHLH